MKKSRFAFLTGASQDYLPGLNALFNSLDIWGQRQDFLLVDYNLPEDYLKKAKDTFNFNIRVFKSTQENQSQGTAIERFKIGYEIGKEYEAICLLDTDQFLVSSVERFFEVASKGFIVTGSNGMIIGFNRDYQQKYGIKLEKDDYPYPLVHTTCPIFLSPADLDWFERLYNSRRFDIFDDFTFLNFLGIVMGKDKKMICLGPQKFTQIHHFGLKPNTRIIRKNGLLLSETEELIYMIHGKWWRENWVNGLMEPMYRYFRDNEFGEKQIREALESKEICQQEFIKYCYHSKLSIKDFQRIPWLEKLAEKHS